VQKPLSQCALAHSESCMQATFAGQPHLSPLLVTVHEFVWQSLGAVHGSPPHLPQFDPPQSTFVSSPSCIPSEQLAHWFA
jgi:hypothetical protein